MLAWRMPLWATRSYLHGVVVATFAHVAVDCVDSGQEGCMFHALCNLRRKKSEPRSGTYFIKWNDHCICVYNERLIDFKRTWGDYHML